MRKLDFKPLTGPMDGLCHDSMIGECMCGFTHEAQIDTIEPIKESIKEDNNGQETEQV